MSLPRLGKARSAGQRLWRGRRRAECLFLVQEALLEASAVYFDHERPSSVTARTYRRRVNRGARHGGVMRQS
jgi:hypothetical protein